MNYNAVMNYRPVRSRPLFNVLSLILSAGGVSV
ncbi:hypothetical protein YPPY64_2773, partial [Yersinia pestis PY-64]